MIKVFDRYGNVKTVTATGAVVETDPVFSIWLATPPNLSEFNNDVGYITSVAGYVPTSRILTINGVAQDLSADRSWTIDALPSQTGNAGKYLTTNGSVASWATVTAGVSSVSGTANRITSTGGSTPVIDIAATYIGQSSITTLGTIVTGVWNGTPVADAYIASATNWNTAFGWGNHAVAGYALDADVLHITGNETKSGVLTLNDTPVAPGYSIPGGTDQQILLGDGTYTDYASVVSGGQVVIFTWKYQTNITAADPGNGFFRGDDANPTLITNLYIDDIGADVAFDISALFAKVNGDWLIHIQQYNDATKFVQFTSSGTYNDNTGWWTLPVTYVQGSGFPLPNGTKCTFVFVNQNAVVSSALTKVDDTNVTLTLGGSPNVALLAATSLTLGWTGTLADGRISSATNWNTAYTNRITSLTTTGSSGASTLLSNTLNIPNYTISGLGGQPLDADLTAIAALTGTSGFLTTNGAGVWAVDTNTYLTTGSASATYQPLDATLTALAGQTITANSLVYGTGTDAFTVLAQNTTGTRKFLREVSSTAPVWDTLVAGDIPDISATYLTVSAASAAYQPLDSDLTTIAGLTATTDNFIVSVASAWASRTPSQVRTTLGLVIGTNVQAWDADLDAIAALGFASTSFLVKTAANTWTLDTNTYLTTATAASSYQPLDSDLTSIAALATTTFGRSLLTETSAATARNTLNLNSLMFLAAHRQQNI